MLGPEEIVLARREALDVLAALDDAHVIIEMTDELVALLDIEDAAAILVGKLFPDGGARQ